MNYHFDYVSRHFRDLMEPAVQRSHAFDTPLSFRVFKNAFIAPYYEWNHSIGCAIDESGDAIKDSECIEWKEDASFYKLDTAAKEHKRVVFLGFLLTGFGHSYTDDLRKLWFLETEEYKSMASLGYELVYTTSWNQTIPENIWEIFRMAGIDIKRSTHITELTQYDEIVIPDNSFRATDYGRIYCKEYVRLLERIKAEIPDPADCPSKVYFTRTKFSANSKNEYGEKAIERVFRKLGYTVIPPEECPLARQFQLIRGCDSFASTDGSVAHLSLFAKPGTHVTIIVKADYLNFHQVAINELADLDVTYVQAHHSSKANPSYPWWGPFYLCINRFLEKYAGRPLLHLPYWMQLPYWEYTENIPYRAFRRMKRIFRRVTHRL